MKTKKILASVLTFTMLISLLTMAGLAVEPEYQDTSAHWAKSEIQKWSTYGILQGSDGEFRPDAPITRAEMAIILDRVMKYQVQAKNSFTDLADNWYTNAILRANAAGIVKGDGISVRPMDKITRQEASVMLCRALNLTEESGATSFADDTSLASWAKGYVKALSQKGLIAGMGENRFAPNENITRAAVVKMLDNAIRGFYYTEGEITGDVDGTVVVNSDKVTLKNMTINGDLIIAEGVGNGEVILDSVIVKGQTVVRGGGPNSIKVQGESNLGKVIIQKKSDGTVSIKVTGNAKVNVVVAEDGSINVTGAVTSLEVKGEVAVNLVGASIKTINVDGAAGLTVDKASNVDDLSVSASKTQVSIAGTVGMVTTTPTAVGARISTEAGAKVTAVVAKAEGTTITGSGTVTSVKAEGNNVAVSTPNTKVDAAPGTSGVTAGGTTVNPGQSTTTDNTAPSGGGGGGGGGTPATTQYTFKVSFLKDAAPVYAGTDNISIPNRLENDSFYTTVLTSLINNNETLLKNAIDSFLGKIKDTSLANASGTLSADGKAIADKAKSKFNTFQTEVSTQATTYIDMTGTSKTAFDALFDAMNPDSFLITGTDLKDKDAYYTQFKSILDTFFLRIKEIEPANGKTEAQMVTFVASKFMDYYAALGLSVSATVNGAENTPFDQDLLVTMINAIRDVNGNQDVTVKEWLDATHITKISIKRMVAAQIDSHIVPVDLQGQYTVIFELNSN